MWATSPGRLSRTSSMHSLARSVTSSRGSSYEESIGEVEEFPARNDMWKPAMRTTPPDMWKNANKLDNVVNVVELSRRDSISSEHPTLAEDMTEDELEPKTPTVKARFADDTTTEAMSQTSTMVDQPVGPLEQQLIAMISKIGIIERGSPTIMADDYNKLQSRVAALEAEKADWQERHHAIFALRDDDLSNLMKVRCLLADERREHAAIRQLRDDDLHHVLELREKLAKATWTRPTTPETKRQSRPENTDLWQVAKSAAMEHRVLELEKANEDLLRQVEAKGDLGRIEVLLDENMRQREKMAQKVQQLRSEKEALQRDLGRLEDENSGLEAKMERLQRRAAL